MLRRQVSTETTDAFGEFLAEHAGLWPERQRAPERIDPFTEFATEGEGPADTWLTIAKGRTRTPPRVLDYRHMLAVASVLLSVFTPAGVISTAIIGRQLRLTPLEASHWAPPPSLFQASIDRLIGFPAGASLPSLPEPQTSPASTSINAGSAEVIGANRAMSQIYSGARALDRSDATDDGRPVHARFRTCAR